jgi:hypothetical protein
VPKELQAICPHCSNVRIYRATSVGRDMRCHHCGLLFTLPAPPGLSFSAVGAGFGVVGLLAAFLLCGGCLYLGGLLPRSSTTSTHLQQAEDDKPKATTHQQKEDAAKLAKQAEQERKEEERREREEAKRRDMEEAKRKAEDKKAEERAGAYLRYAKKMADNGQTDKAKERLQDILRDMPKTEAAKEARLLLEKLTP